MRIVIKHSKQCLTALMPSTANFVKNSPLRVAFSTLLSVLETWSKAFFHVWYIAFLFRCMHVSGRAGEWCVIVVWLFVRTMMWLPLTCVTELGAGQVHGLFKSHDDLSATEWESEDMDRVKARVLRYATSNSLFCFTSQINWKTKVHFHH